MPKHLARAFFASLLAGTVLPAVAAEEHVHRHDHSSHSHELKPATKDADKAPRLPAPAMAGGAASSCDTRIAACPRTRAEVLEELRQAQADGSLRRMNTNRGY